MKTSGNFIVTGAEGERIAAFATESDKRLFEAASDMLAALKAAESDQMAYVDRLRNDGARMAVSHSEAQRRLEATRAAIAKASGAA